MKLTHKQRIEKAHIALMRNKDTIWLAPVCMIGKVVIDPSCPTASTDGRDVAYGADFLDKLNDAQVRATVVHENYHKAMLHLTRHKYLVERYVPHYGLKGARMLVNMAQDYVINREIKKLAPFCETWDGIIQYCYDAKYDNDSEWDTDRIAADLHQQQQQKPNKGKGGGKGEPGDGIPGGQDDHDWDGAQEMTEGEAEKVANQIEQALRQGEAMSRKMAGNMPRAVGELLEPAVDWRQALRDFVQERVKGGDFSSFARPNRKYVGYGVYMPSSYTETVKSIAFMVDTSGSIGPEALREVLSELRGCVETVKPEAVDIIYWDTAVARHEHYVADDADSILRSTQPAGGGGTSPSCVVPYCREHKIEPTVAIWLSDGYVGGDWAEDLGCPAFWVISHGGQTPSHLPHVLLPNRL